MAPKEARKDGPSLLRSLISGANTLVVVKVVVVLVVCCVDGYSSRCSSYNDLDFGGMDLLDVFSNRMDWMYL